MTARIHITRIYPYSQFWVHRYIYESIPYGTKTPHYIYNEKYTLW